tara:strand:- start:60712 stop:62817 length:2106 start_codon:yes stop_codon:yes gene_type:complete
LGDEGNKMRKKILVKGPALSRSGYGEQTRFALRSLRSQEEKYDIYLQNIPWGQTGWIFDDNEERTWIDACLAKSVEYVAAGGKFDMSLQVTIPNEWEKLAPVNIGYTAGIETNQISPAWIEKTEVVDKIITISEHSKDGFLNTVYDVQNKETGQVVKGYRCETPVEVVHYPVRNVKPAKLDLELENDFNFLVLAQWGVRKNLENTIRWFVEEFIDRDVGLVIKTNAANDSIMDRDHCEKRLQELLSEYENRQCKVYMIHGTMKEDELAGLYNHPKIKALISLTHGEGYGLPIFEAAYYGLPVITAGWSGHVDFLSAPVKEKNKKVKVKPLYAKVDFDVKRIQKEARWEGVIEKRSEWCYPREGSAKMRMREVYKSHGRFKSNARKLQSWILENFTEEQKYEQFANAVCDEKIDLDCDYVFVSDRFADQAPGGAELSFQAVIDTAPGKHLKLNASDVSESLIDTLKDKTWIFSNFTAMDKSLVPKIAENLKYYFIESDYKYCEHRLPQLCQIFNGGEDCVCVEKDSGQLIKLFCDNAQLLFFRSENQRAHHLSALDLKKKDTRIMSAVFTDDVLNYIQALRKEFLNKKVDVWVVSSSPSWVKGHQASKKWCEENNKQVFELHGKSYKESLACLAQARGLCALPPGYDTCPRMVIEAKLLGCELQLNENVLHADEKWFATDDIEAIEAHLRSVVPTFWKEVSV